MALALIVSVIQNTVLGWFGELGYAHLNGSKI